MPPAGPGPGPGPGGAPDKRTTAYENIFGRPTAKPKGPQPQQQHLPPYPPAQPPLHHPALAATHNWVAQQAVAGGSSNGGVGPGAPSPALGFPPRWAGPVPAQGGGGAGGSAYATAPPPPQRYAPSPAPSMRMTGGSIGNAGVYQPMGTAGYEQGYAAPAGPYDKRASVAPSLSSQASTSTGAPYYNYYYNNNGSNGSGAPPGAGYAGGGAMTSAADAYGAPAPSAYPYSNGSFSASQSRTTSPALTATRMTGGSIAYAHPPQQGPGVVAGQSLTGSSIASMGIGSSAATSFADDVSLNSHLDISPKGGEPPKLPSIELHGSSVNGSSEDHWFSSNKRNSGSGAGGHSNNGGGNGGGAAAAVHSRPSAGSLPGVIAEGYADDSHAAATSAIGSRFTDMGLTDDTSAEDGRSTPVSPPSRAERYAGYGQAPRPMGDMGASPDDGYRNDFQEWQRPTAGRQSAGSSIYEGRRRGSFESDRQSIANSIYTLPGQPSGSSRSYFGLTPAGPPAAGAGGYFPSPNPGFSPFPGAVQQQRMRTTSTATQAAQAAYAPGYAEAGHHSQAVGNEWRQSIDASPSSVMPVPSRFEQRSLSMGTGAQSRPALSALTQLSGTGPMPSGGSTGSAGGTGANGGAPTPTSRRGPVVYPALLSRVAEAFKQRVSLAERAKDGLTYTDCFDGREAVDRIAYIIKTTDRNLALLLGRALDAQKFFHDVTYDHRLRDSPNELYQFRVRLATPFGSETEVYEDAREFKSPPPAGPRSDPSLSPERAQSTISLGGTTAATSATASVVDLDSATTTPSRTRQNSATIGVAGGVGAHSAVDVGSAAEEDENALPTGVFTLLTDCYSPTCTRDRLCYSIACPRRLEQQARLNMKPQPVLNRSISRDSLNDVKEAGALWADGVSKEVLDSLSDQEKKRQELINEVMYTERDFVRDLEYLRDNWIKPLRSRDIVPEDRRDDFVTQVFWNVLEIHAVNSKLAELLTKRQKQQAVVERIGDILLEFVPHFQPFVKYGAHQLYGKYEFEKEKAGNPAFARFVDETERMPESRKLELNGYLTKPTTRLARYPLLLEAVIKATPDDNPDKQSLPRVIKIVKEFLAKVNTETGKSENRFNLAQLDQQLVFKQGEAVDLRLRDEQRELVFKGPLKKRGGTQSESAELQVFLFDHALLMVKAKTVQKHELYKVFRKPIPLELLIVTVYDEVPTGKGNATRPKSVMSKTSTGNRLSGGVPTGSAPKQDQKTGYALTFTYLGRKGYSLTLWASTFVSRRKWFEHIEARQEILRQRSNIFDMMTLSENFFTGPAKVNCSVPFDFGRRIVYGTDDGVYLSDLREKARPPTKVLPLPGVTQIDVLEEYQILIILAERSVHTFTLDALDPSDPMGSLKRGRRISSHTSFFKAGQCLGRTLVCVVRSSSLSSTIKTLEPIEQNVRNKKQQTFRKLLQGGQETLRVFKEFYIPTESSSIHFLRHKLCVGCTKGFEIVDLETLDTQGLLDPADSNLDFVQRKESVKPIAIYRIGSEFLLCYDEFAFYVNKNGWRAKGNWIIHWEGNPTAFALHLPYVLAFEPSFIEVRHVETGALHQVITGYNLRCLFADVPPPAAHGSGASSIASSAASSKSSLFLNGGAAGVGAGLPPPPPPGPPFVRPGMPPGGGAPSFGPGPGPGPHAMLPSPQMHAQAQAQALARTQSFNVLGGGAARPGPPPPPPPRGMMASPSPYGRPPIPGAPPPPPPPPGGPHMVYGPRPGVPFAFTHAAAPRPAPPPRNPVWESVAASRNQIVFIGDTTVFCVRPAMNQQALG